MFVVNGDTCTFDDLNWWCLFWWKYWSV